MTEYHDCGHGRHVGAYCEDCAKEVFGDGFDRAFEALADGVEKANEIGRSLCSHGLHPGFCIDCFKDEISRCIRAFEHIKHVAEDMLDEEKRRGPVSGLQTSEDARRRLPNDGEEG